MEEKRVYEPLVMEILEVQIEKGYAMSAVSGDGFGDNGSW